MAANSEISASPSKKPKYDSGDEVTFTNLDGFHCCQILNENAKQKFLFIHGKKDENDAVLLLEKTPFPSDSASLHRILSAESFVKETLKNDIYGTYDANLPNSINGVKATIIYPATEKHIAKYREQEFFVVQETADMYKNITLPHIESQKFSLQWVYNILEKKSESDRIIYEDQSPDTGFILLPDMKWDRNDINSLYLQAIVHTHKLKSLRDLNQSHLPLLKNILTKGQEVIMEKFGVPKEKLRVYLHYLPSYYHLHVHFTHLKLEAPGFEADRAHLLLDIIENIQMSSDYYKQRTLIYKVREQDDLYKKMDSS